MPKEVPLGAISPTMSEGEIVEWKVKVGDKVKEGDVLADVQTDKTVMPMESYDEGVVAHIFVEPGRKVAVGERVLLLAVKGEDPKAVAASAGGSATSSPAAPPAAKPAPAAAAAGPKADLPQSGEAAPEAASAYGPYRENTNTPMYPERSASDGNGQHTAPVAAPAPSGGRVRSTPLARKVAKAAGVDLAQVRSSGPGGRVVRNDVEAFLKQKPAAAPAPRPVATPAAASRQAERIPHSPMRKTIAARMLQSKQAAPEIHVTVDVRVDQLLAVRESLNQQLAAEKVKLSVGDFVTKAVALALRRHPGLNASFEADAIVRHGEVNVGIAVALEGGLIVPVLRNADALGLREIRTGSEALFQAARSGKLTGPQLSGGTFTISNLGMYGVKHFDAILNLPEVGILAVGAAEKRPVVEGDALVVGTVMTLTLTADHRAVDGAMAAEFLRTLKGLLEGPAMMLL